MTWRGRIDFAWFAFVASLIAVALTAYLSFAAAAFVDLWDSGSFDPLLELLNPLVWAGVAALSAYLGLPVALALLVCAFGLARRSRWPYSYAGAFAGGLHASVGLLLRFTDTFGYEGPPFWLWSSFVLQQFPRMAAVWTSLPAAILAGWLAGRYFGRHVGRVSRPA